MSGPGLTMQQQSQRHHQINLLSPKAMQFKGIFPAAGWSAYGLSCDINLSYRLKVNCTKRRPIVEKFPEGTGAFCLVFSVLRRFHLRVTDEAAVFCQN